MLSQKSVPFIIFFSLIVFLLLTEIAFAAPNFISFGSGIGTTREQFRQKFLTTLHAQIGRQDPGYPWRYGLNLHFGQGFDRAFVSETREPENKSASATLFTGIGNHVFNLWVGVGGGLERDYAVSEKTTQRQYLLSEAGSSLQIYCGAVGLGIFARMQRKFHSKKVVAAPIHGIVGLQISGDWNQRSGERSHLCMDSIRINFRR